MIIRKPRTLFVNNGGFFDVQPDNNISNETMHPTVRFFTENFGHRLQPPEILRGISPARVDSDWLWTLVDGTARYQVWEWRWDADERTLLQAWLEDDLNKMQENAQPGDSPPNTLVVRILAFMDSFN